MPHLTEEELREIKARENAAMPPPWEWCTVETHPHSGAQPGDADLIATGLIQGHVLAIRPSEKGMTGGRAPRPEDAEFIAHARADVPRLIEEIERLQELLKASADQSAKIEELESRVEELEAREDARRIEEFDTSGLC